MSIDTLDVLEQLAQWNFLPFAPGWWGHCIGVDPYYLTHKAEQLGYPQVVLAGSALTTAWAVGWWSSWCWAGAEGDGDCSAQVLVLELTLRRIARICATPAWWM